MFRLMSRAVCHFYKQSVPVELQKATVACSRINELQLSRNFSILQNHLRNDNSQSLIPKLDTNTLFKINPYIIPNIEQTRSVTKFSLKKGKRKTVKAVIKRFYRLNWGAWIRTKAGKQKHLWKKSSVQRRRLKQHIFVNATQSWLLDSMVTNYWRKPKYYVEDPYEPYHKREEYCKSRRKPVRS